MSESTTREFLIDVSRLIWRSWRGRPATGIDRVCLAYLERFGPRSQMVIQRGGHIFVLSPGWSDRLGRLLLGGSRPGKTQMLSVLVPALATASRSPAQSGMTYLNVGHTGLDEPALPAWIAENGIRAVYLVHDLIPLTHPQYCRAGEAAKHERRITNVLASARGVIANSRDTLDELTRFGRSKDMRLPQSIVARLGSPSIQPRIAPPETEHPYFVSVGTIEARKNHLLLLEVWQRLVRSMGPHAPKLVIVGERGWEAEQVLERLDNLGDLDSHVREISSCSDQELAGWVANARALLMPSFAEGFGLPVIEALQFGTPVIASDLPVFREIVEDIPTYLDPRDTVAWEGTIRSFITDGAERKRQLALIAEYRAPSWDEHFESVENWLVQL